MSQSAVRAGRQVHPASYLVISVLFSVIFFVLSFVGDHGILQVKRQRRELARVQGQVQQMWDENQRLEAEIAALKSDPKAVEKIAREDLGFARPDEVVIRLPKGWRNRVGSSPKPGPAR